MPCKYLLFKKDKVADSISLNVPPISLSNVPPVSLLNVPGVSEWNVPPVSLLNVPPFINQVPVFKGSLLHGC